MAANVQEISIPVKLEVLRSSISDLEKILNNLQPNTSGWKSLSKLIGQMQTEAEKLQAQLNIPFGSQKQFNAATKTIDQIEQIAARIRVAMENLKFSDIKLSPEQTKQFESLEQEILNIRNAYKQLQDDVKKELLSNSTNSSLIAGLNVKTLESDFEDIKAAVDKHVADLESSVTRQQEAFNKLKSNIELGERAKILTSSKGGLTREALGDSFFNQFLTDASGQLKMKVGVSKQSLIQALEQEFQLEPGQLQHLANRTLAQINEAFQQMGSAKDNPLQTLVNAANKGNRNRGPQYTELQDLKAQLEEYRRLATELDSLKENKLDPVQAIDTQRIEEVKNKMAELQQQIFTNMIANSNYGSSFNTITSQLASFKSQLEATNAQFLKMQHVQQSFNAMKMTIINFMGFNQVLRLVRQAVKEATTHIKELDTVMNKISIVTNMSTSDLWGQMDTYSTMAQRYGVAIKGAYEVSQIYYQQGLETKDVMTLTNETLKLAKVSGLDYAQTTDYMTTALRGFKMEMSEAATVVDVYSNLAAHTAVTQEELAVAMSKTASSMESVGASFEETSAMIATMVAVTRESSTNIGSAMKSIASRYGEMKKAPTSTKDSEGEEMDFNKVDTALKSVGITMKTSEGQFRNFTDVIIELSEKWDELESTQQRYIATQFAGNRQQSRFLALVSNKDLLKSNLEYAKNSENVGTLQAIKALDSLESKIEQVRVAYQQFYTTIGIESVWKGFLDGAKNVVNTLNRMPKLFGTLPIGAINAIAQIIAAIKHLAISGLTGIAKTLGNSLVEGARSQAPQAQAAGETWITNLINGIKNKFGMLAGVGQQAGQVLTTGFQGSAYLTSAAGTYNNPTQISNWSNRLTAANNSQNPEAARQGIATEMHSQGLLTSEGMAAFTKDAASANAIMGLFNATLTQTTPALVKAGTATMGFGTALNMISLMIDTSTKGGKQLSGVLQTVAGVAITAGAMIKRAGETTKTIPWVAIASGIIAVINGITQLLQSNSLEAQLEEFTTQAEKLSNRAKELQSNYKTLESSSKKIKELEQARYDSADAAEEYNDAVNKLAELFPQLIAGYDSAGNAIITAVSMENTLTIAREEAAKAALAAAIAEKNKAETELELGKNKVKDKANAVAGLETDYAKTDTGGLVGKTHLSYLKVFPELLKKQNLTDDELELRSLMYDEIKKLLKLNGQDLEDMDQLITNPELMNKYTNRGYYGGEQDVLNNLFDKMADAAKNEQYDLAGHYHSLIQQLLVLEDWDLTNDAKEKLGALSTEISQLKPYQDTVVASDKAAVYNYMQSKYGSLPFFQNNTGLSALAQTQLYNEAKKNDNFTEGGLAQAAGNTIEEVNTFWNNLSTYQQEVLNTIFSNMSSYTQEDFANKWQELFHTDDMSALPDWILSGFETNSAENKERLQKKLDQIYESDKQNSTYTAFDDIIKDEQQITLEESQLLSDALGHVTDLKSKGQSTKDFTTDFINFYNEITGIEDAVVRNGLIAQFRENGFTKEGIEKTKKYIESTDALQGFDIDFLDQLAKDILPNIIASTNAVVGEFKGNYADIEKSVDKMQSGITPADLDKEIANAKKLGLEVTADDFQFNGSKYVINGERLLDAIDNLKGAYQAQFDGMDQDLDDAYNIAKTNFQNVQGESGKENLEAVQLVLGGRFTEFYEQNEETKEWALKESVTASPEALGKFTTVLFEQYENGKTALTDLNIFFNTMAAQLQKTANWNKGNYTSVAGTLGIADDVEDYEEQVYNRIKELAEGGEWDAPELHDPEVASAVQNYQKGYESLLSDLTSKGLDYVTQHISQYQGINSDVVLDEIDAADDNIVTLTRIWAKSAGKSISETNSLITAAITKNSKLGQQKAVSDLASDGFSLDDLSNYINTYDPTKSISEFVDDSGKLLGELANVFEFDEDTGTFKAIAGKSAEEITDAFEKALGVKLVAGTKLYKSAVQEVIDTANENDKGKQASSVLSQIVSAKVGDRIDTSMAPELEKVLGTQTTHIFEVASEFERDSLILALNPDLFDEEYKAAVKSAQDNIKSKRSKGKGFEGIINKTFSKDAAKTYLTSQGIDPESVNIDTEMGKIGYVWDEYLEEYRAGADAIKHLKDKLEEAKTQNASEETINKLQADIYNLEAELTNNDARDALVNLLSNYTDVSDDVLSEFKAQFDNIDISKYITTDTQGRTKVNIIKLMQEMGAEWTNVFDESISQMIDDSMDGISSAMNLAVEGTTNESDIESFKNKVQDLIDSGYNPGALKKVTEEGLFVFDETTKTYQLTEEAQREYIWAERERLEALGRSKTEIDKIIAKSAAEQIDLSSFYKAENREAGSNAYKLLEDQVRNYINSTNSYSKKDRIDQLVKEWMTDLTGGGKEAVSRMQTLAKDKGQELTADEISEAYRSLIEPYVSLMDKIKDLEKGSVVDKTTAAILSTIDGFKIDENGIIESIGNLADAYHQIYLQISNNTEHTISEANKALGLYLDNRNNQKVEQTIEDAFDKAAEMTYSDFAQLYTDLGKELTEEDFLLLESQGIVKSLGSNKMQIADFNAFAAQQGWDTASEQYKNGYSAYVDSIISSNEKRNADKRAATQLSNLASAKVGETVNIYDIPDEIKKLLGAEGQDTYTVASEAARDNLLLAMTEAIDDASLANNPQLRNQIEQLQEELLSKRNKYTGLSNILKDNISLSDAQSFVTSTGFDKSLTKGIMEARGYVYDAYTQTFKITSDAIAAAYGDIEYAVQSGADKKTINELKASANELAYMLNYGDKNNAIINALKNYNNLSNEAVATIKNAFIDDIDDSEWASLLTYDASTGISKLDVKSFLIKLNKLKETTQIVFNEAIEQQLTELTDTYFKDISTGINFVKAGTTSQSEMLAFTQKLNEASGQLKSVGEYFQYDTNLEAFTLNADAMHAYIESQKEIFEQLGISGPALDRYIEDQTNKMLAEQINFQEFLSASDRSGTSKVTQKLVKAYKDWYQSKNGKDADNATVALFVNTLNRGGQAAVDAIKEIKGSENVSTDEIKALYQADFTRLQTAISQLENIAVGQIIDGSLVDVIKALNDANFKITDLGDGTAVVEAVGDMIGAYKMIYSAMKESSGKTTKDLNALYAKLLNENEKQDIDAISTLQNAMGMTYDALGELLAKYNKELEDVMLNKSDYGLEQIGGGKVRIFDFAAFASSMGWEQGSEEYISAFKTYNDSLIALNRKTEKSILEEVNSITDAKAGDKINVTQFANYFKSDILGINQLLERYGASIKDGILTLGDNADIVGIASTLGTAAYQAGLLLSDEMAQLEDKIIEILSNITELIGNGISGNLSNESANTLNTWAKQQGLIQEGQSLNFIRTKEGLKLSTEEAIKLYNAMSQIDDLQGSIIFDGLRESLESTNENYKSMSSLIAHINDLRAKKDTEDPTKREQYEAELKLAQQIAEVRATSEDDSFNFMSNKIPGGQNNPLNYFENWGKAWKTLRDSFKAKGKDKAKIEYEDFYNIITEMGHLAEISGQPIKVGANQFVTDAESASKLIEKGAQSLTVAADGSIKVDLSKFGMNFSSGSKEMAANVDKGIHEMAQSQVAMLDSMISLLETIVAMEALEDVDVDNDMTIEVPEISVEGTEVFIDGIEYIGQFTDKYNIAKQKILDTFSSSDNEDLQGVLNDVKVNGRTIKEILSASEKDLQDWKISADQMSKILTGLYQLSKSDMYDENDVWNSFMQIFSGLDFGDATISVNKSGHEIILQDGGDYQINWDSEQVKKNIENALASDKNTFKNAEELEKIAKDAFEKLKNKQTITVEENYALSIVTGEIKVTTNDKGETKYKVGSKEYNTVEAATQAATLVRAGADAGKVEVTTSEGGQVTATSTITIGKEEVTITTSGDGKVTYKVDGMGEYDSREAAIKALTAKSLGLDSDHVNEVTDEQVVEYKKKVGLIVEPLVTMSDDSKSKITKEVQNDIKKALDSGQGDKVISIAESVGITVNPKVADMGKLSVDELNELYAAFGIESKSVSLDASVNASGNEKIIELIETGTGTATIDVSLNTNNNTENPEAPTIPDINIDANIEGVKNAIDEAKAYAEKTKAFQKVDFGGGNVHDGVDDGVKYAKKHTALQNIDVGSNTVPAQINSNVRDGSLNSVKQSINVSNNYVWNAINNNVTHGRDNPVYQRIINKEGGAAGNVGASGSIGLVTGNAKAQGTLMGELGPELVVSNGHYFVVGQNGPEMVNLADDAIVFNHLQTKSLLEKGTSPGRGRAITNEQNAVSYATGNIGGGPAMASASAALAALKQLRSMWQALANISVSDLAGKGGGGGGGGDKGVEAAWIAAVERWYNLLQKIAQLEKDITHEETLRTKLQSDYQKNGKAYYESQKRSLQNLEQQEIAQEQLNIDQQDYFNQRREQLNNSIFNKFYTFDENGQLKYAQYDNPEGGYSFLADLMSVDDYGKPKYNAKEQYEKLVAAGFEAYMQYDSSGKAIVKETGEETAKGSKGVSDEDNAYAQSVQAFWDQVDSQREEMQTLHDDIVDGQNKVLELENARNEILEEIRNNQMELEKSVLEAVENQRQRAIDNLSDERKALEESTNKYIEGLTEALGKEREMYELNNSSDELNRKRRQLGIMQRSGASASQIESLQEEIRNQEQSMYFDLQQQQIDAIKSASDLELERLDNQIELETELLEYQKDFGLLWGEVYAQMEKTPQEITEFITANNPELWAASPLSTAEGYNKTLFSAAQWEAFKKDQETYNAAYIANAANEGTTIADAVYGADSYDWKVFNTAMTNLYGDQWKNLADKYKVSFQDKMAATGDITQATVDITNKIDTLGTTLVTALTPTSTSSSISAETTSDSGDAGTPSPSKKPTPPKSPTYTFTYDGKTYTAKSEEDANKQINDLSTKERNKANNNQGQTIQDYHYNKAENDAKKARDSIKKKAAGGYVGHGIYELGERGTETVLTAEQTQVLRNNILSNRPNSLISLLKSYNENYSNIANITSGIPQTTDNSVNIENVKVEMNVSKIANDYDAQRAGEQALAEMMRIARKTNAANSIRR